MNSPDSMDVFDRSWSAQVLPSPPMIAPARQYIYPQQVPGEEDALQRGALLVQVKPASGGVFLATCALGFREASLPSGVWACPHPDRMLAIAGGYAYLIDTGQPASSLLLEQRPVTAVVATQGEGLLLLAGFHDVLAVGAEGVRWRSARLSWEGLTIRGVESGLLHGDGWDMFSDAEVPFTVDLATGTHQGGGYKR